MDAIKDGWFTEIRSTWPGHGLSIQVKEVLYHERSAIHDILVFQSDSYGRVLVLDGSIQATERDVFAAHEMSTCLPINSHPHPEKVLILGGGLGASLVELDRHPSVKEVVVCEIDEKVIEVSKKFFPNWSRGFDSPKLKLLNIGDGFKYIKNHLNEFDVILSEFQYNVGSSESVSQFDYLVSLKNGLRPGGILFSTGESLWLHLDFVNKMRRFCEELFPVVGFATIAIPTWGEGLWGCILCSTNPDTDFTVPLRRYTADEVDKIGWKYYNSEIHTASFALPQFAILVIASTCLSTLSLGYFDAVRYFFIGMFSSLLMISDLFNNQTFSL